MVNLGYEEVQEPSKEWVQRQRKTALDMAGEENTFTIARLRLKFVPGQPPGPMCYQAIMGEIFQVLLHDSGTDPVPLDPTRQQTGPRR